MKRVAFHIFGRSAERTAYLMRKVLRRYPYLRVGVEGARCVISSDQVSGSLNTWLIERLLRSRLFLGRYHDGHVLYDAERKEAVEERYRTCLCRFGLWDSVDAEPEELRGFDYSVRRTELRLKGLPDYSASARAMRELSYDPYPPDRIDDSVRAAMHLIRRGYIEELVERYGVDPETAVRRVDRRFKRYDVPMPEIRRAPVDPEVARRNSEAQNKRLTDMMDTLKFLGCPRRRRLWLMRNDDHIGDLFLRFVLHKRGREWFVERVGEIEGIT